MYFFLVKIILIFFSSLAILMIKYAGSLCFYFDYTYLQCTTMGPCLAVWWDPTTARIRRRNSRTELEKGQVWLGHSV
jgi:hypothetical protein